ncbi:MAG: AmmeMemoRadiSam system radical SAM enzyme [Treponema sp.]|jgi:pyruvate formate lyase activating enzyme|nr:AmmeMemoRadiSam system radical SAM enzyme [Treponema sp.]
MNKPLFLTGGSDIISCELCPHFCKIKNGSFGLCGARGNKGGIGIIPFYGFITALAMDPIEKKPLYHFKPGSQILSLGFAGCNLRCPFCQNWHISQLTDISKGAPSGKYMKPGEIISAALKHNSPSIAYTYSEPLIHIEFLLDCMTLARKHGIANVLVSNGSICANNENSPAAEILALTSAANIDLKCFSEETYKKCLGGNLETTLDFIKLAYSMGVHLEVTTLVVPDLNDSDEELDKIAAFLASVENTDKRAIPWHLTAYHPDYRWNAPRTDPAFLRRTALRAKNILRYVHTGNV